MDKLSGYKTYLIAGAAALLAGVLAADQVAHFLTPDVAAALGWLLGALGAGGAATLRAAVAKVESRECIEVVAVEEAETPRRPPGQIAGT